MSYALGIINSASMGNWSRMVSDVKYMAIAWIEADGTLELTTVLLEIK